MVRGAAIGALLYLLGNFISADGQLNALSVDWLELLGYTLGGALLSLLFSVAGNAKSKNGPAFTDRLQTVPPVPNTPQA